MSNSQQEKLRHSLGIVVNLEQRYLRLFPNSDHCKSTTQVMLQLETLYAFWLHGVTASLPVPHHWPLLRALLPKRNDRDSYVGARMYYFTVKSKIEQHGKNKFQRVSITSDVLYFYFSAKQNSKPLFFTFLNTIIAALCILGNKHDVISCRVHFVKGQGHLLCMWVIL